MPEAADAADEGLLHEVLGLLAVAGEQERQAHPGWDVPRVQLRHASLGRLTARTFVAQLGRLSDHTLQTNGTPGRYRRWVDLRGQPVR